MKAIIKKYFLIITILAGSVAAQAQQYVKKDTSITYLVHNISNVPATYTWSVSPSSSLLSFSASTDSTQFIKWSDTGHFVLSVIPISPDGCKGDMKTLTVISYTNPNVLPIQPSWPYEPGPVCADPNGGSVIINAQLKIVSTLPTGSDYKLYYQIDNDSIREYIPANGVSLNTNNTLVTLEFSSTLFTATDVAVTHNITAVKIVSGTITESIWQVLPVQIKAIPALNNEIEY